MVCGIVSAIPACDGQTKQERRKVKPMERADALPARRVITIPVAIERDEDGYYLLSCPGLPVCTEGRDAGEAKEMIVDAVECFFDACHETGALDEVMAGLGATGGGPLPDIRLDFDGEMLEIRRLRAVDPDAPMAAYG